MDDNETETPKLPKPTDYDQLFPGRFLKAGLFKGRNVTLTIKEVDVEKLPSDKGGDRIRGILSFVERDMQLVLNKTNGVCVRAMFGRNPQEWVGKRLTLSPEKDKFGRETVDAIRIAGSPDISEAVEVEIKLPKRKPKKRRLVPTVAKKKGDDAAPPDERDDDPGEPPEDRTPGEEG